MRQKLLIAAALLLSLPAAAQPDSEAIARFGLEGHWAISCAAEPAPSNPHIRVAASDTAPPTRALVTGNAALDNVLELTNARPVGARQLTFQELSDGKLLTFLVVMEDDRYRVDEMVTSDGKALVTHAVQNWDGKPSPWYQRCP
jgi:hypothetical protein